MAKKTCPKGHIYDVGIYGDDCPFCTPQNSVGGKTIISGAVQGTPKFCPQCGTTLTGGIKFCPSCGSAILADGGDTGVSQGGETQISAGAKTVIYGHAPESEPTASEPAPSVPVVSVPQVPAVAESAPATQIAAPPTAPVSPATVLAGVAAAVQQTAGKKKRLWVIVAAAVVVVGGIIFFTKYEKPLVQNENGNVIFTSVKNNNSYIDNLKITTKHLKKFIQLGKQKDPDTEAFDDFPDDYRIELFATALNNGEALDDVNIYLEGISNMAGYSTVYGCFYKNDENELVSFDIYFDTEYLDKSGIEYTTFSPWTISDKYLSISKYRYTDTNEIYYSIFWNRDLTKKQRREILNNFFNKLRYSNVYNDPKFDKKWFAEIYTDIGEHQQIGDLFEIK